METTPLRSRLAHARPLLALTALLPIGAWLVFSRRAEGWLLESSLGGVVFSLVAALCMLVIHGLARAGAKMRGQCEPQCYGDLTLAVLLVGCVPVATSGCAYISDVYRQASVWYDAPLWHIEQPLFVALHGPLSTLPVTAWEVIYACMWPFVVFALCLLVHVKRDREALAMAVAAPVMFYAAQVVALVLPVTGPALFDPSSFGYLQGSMSADNQSMLLAYKEGRAAQNGAMYALVSLPSLHIALTWLAGSYLVTIHRFFRPIVVLVFVAIWLSTLALGWHYVVDGLAGIALAVIAKHAVTVFVRVIGRRAG